MSQPYQQPDANDVLFGGSGAPAVQWQNPATNQDFPLGTFYEGEITKLDSTQQRNIQDKSKLDFWPDGRPKMVALVTIQTNQRDPQREGDDGQRTVWVSGKYLTNAVRDAVRRTGAQRLELGGHLKVTLSGYGKPEPGFRAPRLFEVEYRRPVPGAAGANDALGMTAPQSTAAAGYPEQYQLAQQPGVQPTVQQMQQAVAQPAVQQQLPQTAPVAQQQVAPGQAVVNGQAAPAAAGMPDLSGLDANARALVERMYAQQQGGAQ